MGQTARFSHRKGRKSSLVDTVAGGRIPGPASASGVQAKIAKELFEKSAPIRESLFGRSEDFLQGGLDPTASPMFAPVKNQVESSFDSARDRTIANTPAGGALSSALAQIESGRAGALAQGVGAISQQELQNAMGLGVGQLPGVQAGLGSAAAAQAQEAAAKSSAKGGKGQAVGMLAATAATKGTAGPAAAAASDRRTKENIHKIGLTPGNIPVYLFNYIGDDQIICGVMSDEVKHIKGAVYTVVGVDFVDYGRVH